MFMFDIWGYIENKGFIVLVFIVICDFIVKNMWFLYFMFNIFMIKNGCK